MSWSQLRDELACRAARGQVVRFWFRDDDAIDPSPALTRLAEIGQALDITMVIAVVPAKTGDELAAFLKSSPNLRSAQHGWSHANHAPSGAKKQELVATRPQIFEELSQGFSKLSRLHGERFLPMLVPPWNRVDPALLPHLPDLGYRTLSTFGPDKPGPIRTLNTHIDLIDWHDSRNGRNHSEIIRDIIDALDLDSPIGILSHHLVSDAPAFDFIEQFLRLTAQHPACAWLRPADLA